MAPKDNRFTVCPGSLPVYNPIISFEQVKGFEPLISSLATKYSTAELYLHFDEPSSRIELESSDYETDIFPFNYEGLFPHGATESNCILKIWRLLGYHNLRRKSIKAEPF